MLGYRRIDLSAKVLAVLVIAEYLIMIVFDVAVIGQGGADGLDTVPFQGPTVLSGSPSIGLLFCFAAFLGFVGLTIYSEEAKDPRRTVPTAVHLDPGDRAVLHVLLVVHGHGRRRRPAQRHPGGNGDPTTLLFTLAEQ